jgi:hypothetical protein
MRRAALLLSVVVGTVLLAPSGAAGGGWWSSPHFPDEYLVSGETAMAESEVLFASVEAAENAGQFYAYLIPDMDWRIVDRAMNTYPPGRWWRTPDRAVRVGRVEIVGGNANFARVEARFEVPDLPPGRYAFMFCDFECTTPMADIVPVQMTLVDSPQAAVLSRRLDRVRDRAAATVAKVRRNLTSDIYGVQDFSASEHELEFLRDRVVELEDGLAKISGREPPVRTDWRPVIVVGSIGLIAAFVLARRRRIEVLVPVPEPEGKEATRV